MPDGTWVVHVRTVDAAAARLPVMCVRVDIVDAHVISTSGSRRWEGDVILRLSSSAIRTLSERSTRFTMLLQLPHMAGHDQPRIKDGPALPGTRADAVRDAIAAGGT